MSLFGIRFILGAQTSGTDIHLFEFSFKQDGSWMDIWIKSPVGMLLRMANILTEHRCFPA
jgi:hypothetical protein